jgi:DNA-binding response OmpR family regulator
MRHTTTKDQTHFAGLLDELRISVAHSRGRLRDIVDQLEALGRVYVMPAAPFNWGPYGLTASEMRIADLLYTKLSETVARDRIMDMLYHDRLGNIPHDNIVQVNICKMRPKLASSPFRIRTAHGVGFRMERAA